MQGTTSYFQSTVRPILSVLVVFLATLTLSVATGMTAVILPLALEKQGMNGTQIGLLMALLLVVIIPLSLLLPSLIKMLGMRFIFVISTIIRGFALWALPQYTDVYSWAGLVLLYGTGEFTFLFLVQTWIGLENFKARRGFAISMVGVAISAGIALSAFVIELFNTHDINLYNGMAIISVAAFIPILLGFFIIPRFRSSTAYGLKYFLHKSPLVMGAAIVAGVQIMGVQYFITIYGMRAGLSLVQASYLLSCFTLGPIVLETFLAFLSDHFERRNVIMAGTFFSLICAIYLPLAIYYPYSAWGLLFVWGGIIGGVYSIAMAILRDRYSEEELIPATAAFTTMFGVGAVIGVVSIGVMMDLFGSIDALPAATNIVNFIFFCFAASRYIKALSRPSGELM